MIDLLYPRGVLITGIEQDLEEPGFDRVYIGPRYHWRYVLVDHGTVTLHEGDNTTVLPADAAIYQDEQQCAPQYLSPEVAS